VLVAGLSAGRSYTFSVHAENGVSDQTSDDTRQPQRITVATQPAGAPAAPHEIFMMIPF